MFKGFVDIFAYFITRDIQLNTRTRIITTAVLNGRKTCFTHYAL